MFVLSTELFIVADPGRALFQQRQFFGDCLFFSEFFFLVRLLLDTSGRSCEIVRSLAYQQDSASAYLVEIRVFGSAKTVFWRLSMLFSCFFSASAAPRVSEDALNCAKLSVSASFGERLRCILLALVVGAFCAFWRSWCI